MDQHIADDIRGFDSLNAKVQRQWEWKDKHEREAADLRLDLQKQIGKLESGIQTHDSHYSEILRVVNSISVDVSLKFDKLEKSIEQMRRN